MLKNITKHPISMFVEPSAGLYKVYKEYYWVVDKEKNILCFSTCSWQTNVNKEVVENIRDKCYPGYDVIQIPYIFIPYVVSQY